MHVHQLYNQNVLHNSTKVCSYLILIHVLVIFDKQISFFLYIVSELTGMYLIWIAD